MQVPKQYFELYCLLDELPVKYPNNHSRHGNTRHAEALQAAKLLGGESTIAPKAVTHLLRNY